MQTLQFLYCIDGESHKEIKHLGDSRQSGKTDMSSEAARPEGCEIGTENRSQALRGLVCHGKEFYFNHWAIDALSNGVQDQTCFDE